MPLINSLITWFNTKRLHEIDLFRKYPCDVQHENLFRLIDQARDTEWGRKYKFKSIHRVDQFQERVPVQTYDDVKPFIERLKKGEENLLWPGQIKWFAKSSGTTSDKSKFIPVTQESLDECHFRGGKDVLAIYTDNNPETNVLSGKSMIIGGSQQINNISNNSYYGDLSAILISNTPFWVEFIRTPSPRIALHDKWEEKLEMVAKEAIQDNVTSIAGVPSWNLVLIKYILQYTGKKNLLELWPDLELFIHGGISFIPYREQFKQVIPSDKMNYLETYNASEGFFGIQDDPSRDDMLLMLDYGIFYEFIPFDRFGESDPPVYTIGEVELYKNYVMLISTNGGLWRYVIGDTVTFTSKFPYKIKISGRTKHYINAFGEEVIVDNAENALKVACEKTGAVIKEYTAGPVFMGEEKKGSHEWLIEFEKEPENMEFFVSLLDNALMSLNSDYEAKRYKNITLDIPLVHSVKKELFYNWLKEKGKLGGQNKIPRLANDRQYLDELLEMNKRL
jgi:hypothetical protein